MLTEDDDIVGRDDILGQILDPGGEVPVLTEIRGELGSGRTSLLRRLKAELGPTATIIDLERYDPGHGGQAGPQVSVGAAQASYARWVALITDIARAVLTPDDVRAIIDVEREARGSHVLAGRTTSLTASLAELDRPFGPREHVQAWNDAAATVSATFVDRWSARAQPVPLLMDNADRVLDQDLGRWLVDLLDDLARRSGSAAARMRVVLARSAAGEGTGDDAADALLPRARVETHALSPLRDKQVVAFIYRFRGNKSPDIHTAQRVEHLTAGHPATLRLVCELLYGPAAPHPDQVDALMRDLPARGRQQAAMLVEEVLTRSGRPDLLRAVQVAAVARRFNTDLLRDLLTVDGYQGNAVTLFDALPALSFVDRQDDEGVVLRVYEYVRLSILARLRSTDSDRLTRLSECAADHFRGLLEKNHKDSGGVERAYGDWYLYEVRNWQADVGEWLYHSGTLTSPSKQRRFLLDTTRLFLDAFFWWGNYVHFDFCDKLVADLGQLVLLHDRPPGSTADIAGSLSARIWPELVTLRQAFVDVLENYPPRSVKAGGADWGVVRDALLTIQDVCGLANLTTATRRQQHVRALLQLFLAHTWRYASWDDGDGDPEIADRAYRRADAAFATVPDDAWARAWVAFERAELALAALRWGAAPLSGPDLEPVRALWERAAAMVQPESGTDDGDEDVDTVVIAEDDDEDDDEDDPSAQTEVPPEPPDHELMSNLHRLRGEILALTSEPLLAAESYRRAVQHAYLFHIVGGPPDEYTLQLYVDVRARALQLLLTCWAQGLRGPELDLLARRLRVARAGRAGGGAPAGETLEDLVTAALDGSPDALADALWPPGPDIGDLGQDGPYAREVRAMRETLSDAGTYLQDLHPFDLHA